MPLRDYWGQRRPYRGRKPSDHSRDTYGRAYTGGLFMGRFVRYAPVGEKHNADGYAATDDAFVKKYPALYEYLCEVTGAAGESRETATLTLFCEEGMWKLCLNDRHTNRVGWISGHSFQDALQALEKALQENKVDFRAKQPYKGSGSGSGRRS